MPGGDIIRAFERYLTDSETVVMPLKTNESFWIKKDMDTYRGGVGHWASSLNLDYGTAYSARFGAWK